MAEGPFWVGDGFFFYCLSPWAASALFSGTTLIYRPCLCFYKLKKKRNFAGRGGIE